MSNQRDDAAGSEFMYRAFQRCFRASKAPSVVLSLRFRKQPSVRCDLADAFECTRDAHEEQMRM